MKKKVVFALILTMGISAVWAGNQEMPKGKKAMEKRLKKHLPKKCQTCESYK